MEIDQKNSGSQPIELLAPSAADSFTTLNDQVRDKIFNSLDAASQANLRLSCKECACIFKSCKRKIRPSWIGVKLAELYPDLEEITLPNLMQGETRKSQFEFLKNTRRLKVLHLSPPIYTFPTKRKDHVDDEFLAELSALTSLKGLKALHLGCCSKVSAKGLEIIKGLSGLETLTACICTADGVVAKKLTFPATCTIKEHDLSCFTNRFEEILSMKGNSERDLLLRDGESREKGCLRLFNERVARLQNYEKILVSEGRGIKLKSDELFDRNNRSVNEQLEDLGIEKRCKWILKSLTH